MRHRARAYTTTDRDRRGGELSTERLPTWLMTMSQRWHYRCHCRYRCWHGEWGDRECGRWEAWPAAAEALAAAAGRCWCWCCLRTRSFGCAAGQRPELQGNVRQRATVSRWERQRRSVIESGEAPRQAVADCRYAEQLLVLVVRRFLLRRHRRAGQQRLLRLHVDLLVVLCM